MNECEKIKLLGVKTLIERVRLRNIGIDGYRSDMNLNLDTIRDLAVAMEMLDQAMNSKEQEVLLLTETMEEAA